MKFKIGKNVSGTDIVVSFSTLDEASDAINALRELGQSVLMEDTKARADILWVSEGGIQRISDDITDNGERVALSLLASWPASKSNSDIVTDTGLSRAGVYDQLTGRRGDKGEWFQQEGELYALTSYGETQVRDLVLQLSQGDE